MKQFFNKLLHPYVFIFFFFFVSFSDLSPGQSLYKWVDDEDTVHMTDTLSQVPLKYRDQVQKKKLETTLQPETAPDIVKKSAGRKIDNGTAGLKHFEIPFEPYEGASRRIIIPVTLNESVTARLLLDTGCPGLMISPKLASRLGLPNEPHEGLKIITGGIGGATPATLAFVDQVRVGDAISEFTPATISEIPSDNFEGLVGMDFLANYRVSIDTNNNVVSFHELPPQSDRPGGHDETWWRSNFQRISSLRDDWIHYLDKMKADDTVSNEKERRLKIAGEQYEEADKLYRKLERHARDNTVPMDWRR